MLIDDAAAECVLEAIVSGVARATVNWNELPEKQEVVPMKFLAISICTATLLLYSAAQAGPFGLEQGTPLIELDIVNEMEPTQYMLASVPRPHPEFESYVAIAAPDVGLCGVMAIGKTHGNDRFGMSIQTTFEEIRRILETNYGKGAFIDRLSPDAMWDGSDEWVMSIAQNERQYRAVWQVSDALPLKDDLGQIILFVSASRSSAANLVLYYEFRNRSECQAAADAAAAGAL